MELLRYTLDGVMRGLAGKKTENLDNNLRVCLKKILTKKELGHIKVKYFNKGIVGLSVDSSVWLYALNLKKEKMLALLKEEISSFKDIKLNIGEV